MFTYVPVELFVVLVPLDGVEMSPVLDPGLVPVEVADQVGGGAVDHGVGHAEFLDEHVPGVL